METKKFYVTCNGNYSWNYNWDNGLSVGEVTLLTEEDEIAHNMYASKNSDFGNLIPTYGENGDVKEVFFNEHSGSRAVDLVVFATNKNRAERYARVWANAHYPVM